MGRKSIAEERRQEILDAFERCIAQYGLEGSSLEQIADEAGVKRSIIRHYVGNRDALVEALVERVTKSYLAQVEREFADVAPERMVSAILDSLFLADSSYDPNERIVIDVLLTTKERYPRAKQLLRAMFEQLIDAFSQELQRAYPHASAEHCHHVAYTIWCISSTNDSLMWLGLPPNLGSSARSHAAALVQSLG